MSSEFLRNGCNVKQIRSRTAADGLRSTAEGRRLPSQVVILAFVYLMTYPSLSDALDCRAGQYLSGSSCASCPLRTFSSVTGATSAMASSPIPSGYYSTTAGANDSALIPCPAGTHSAKMV
eukprot:ANDGO_01447.mRNA.1 hypothetical protein